MPSYHRKVPPTKANFERDHRDKLKLDKAFVKFKKLVQREAKRSREVRELLVPLRVLESAIIIGAFGRHFVFNPPKNRGRR